MLIMSSKGSTSWVTAFAEPVVEYQSKTLGSRVIPITIEDLSMGSPIFRTEPRLAFRNIFKDERTHINTSKHVDYVQASNVSAIVNEILSNREEHLLDKKT